MTAYSNLIAHLADYCLDSRTEPEALVLRNEQIAIVMLERGAEVTDYISERLEAILADVAGDLSLTRGLPLLARPGRGLPHGAAFRSPVQPPLKRICRSRLASSCRPRSIR